MVDIDRLTQQVAFIQEVEKLKLIFRANMTLDASRQENSAEHSWHVTLMALVFFEHSASKHLDFLKVLKMLLIHDIVEIDSGDTWAYAENQQSKYSEEYRSASRVFSLLPSDQAEEFMALWLEFEKQQTEEAKFALVIDGLHPLINHLLTGDRESAQVKISAEKVWAKKAYIKEFAPALWPLTEDLIGKSVDVGLYV